MKCPHCGTENERNAIYCSQCNSWILGKRYEEPTDGGQTENCKKCPNCGAKNALNAIYCNCCDSWILSDKFQEVTLSPAVEPPQPPQAEKPEKKTQRPWLKFGVPAAAVALIAVMLVLLLWPKAGPGASGPAVRYAQHIAPYVHNGLLNIVCDDTVLEMPVSASGYKSYQYSLDGKTAAVLFSSDSLYLVQDRQLQLLDSSVSDYALSTSGDGVLFVTAGKLGYYHSSMDEPKLIPMGSNMVVTDLAISPDGKTCAYVLRNTANSTHYLMCYLWDAAGGISLGAITSSTDLMSVSNGGECIYVADSINVRCYNTKGDSQVLGVYSGKVGSSAIQFTLNTDQTQLLFYYGGKTYLSRNGQKAEVICDATILPIQPQLCTEIYRNNICFSPYYDLLDAYYYELTYHNEPSFSSLLYHRYILWYVDSDGTSRQVAKNVTKYLLDHSCSQLFYVDEKKALRRYDTETGQLDLIVEYVYNMVLSPDGETLYYSYAEGIFCCETAALSKVTKLSTDSSYTMYMGADGRPYYFTGTNGIYGADDQGISQKILLNYQYYRTSDNGYLYVTTADGFYVCGADGTAKKLFSLSNEPVERPYPNVTYG